jgi:curli biogenesis system outer membrane secretion channel CsgG
MAQQDIQHYHSYPAVHWTAAGLLSKPAAVQWTAAARTDVRAAANYYKAIKNRQQDFKIVHNYYIRQESCSIASNAG